MVRDTIGRYKMLEEYLNVHFDSSCHKTPQFKSFARKYKNAITKSLPTGARIVSWSTNHFYCCWYVECDGKYVFSSCSDVRFFHNDWYNHILIRFAKDEHDYCGGCNFYTSLTDFPKKCAVLLELDKHPATTDRRAGYLVPEVLR